MNRILILLGAAALLLGCNNAAKREAAREQAYLDSVARAQAVQDSLAAARPLRKRGRRSAAPAAVTFTAENLPDEPVFDVVTTYGTFQIRLYQDTPLHRDNFVKLALSHYYDSLLVHRVVRDFVVQTGDPFTRDTARVDMYGQGGPDYTIPAEIIRDEEGKLVHRHKKGAVAAARRSDIANPMKESSGSQFYIVLEPENCLHLDGEYTVFGEVISGLAVLERIGTVKTDRYERPIKDIRVRRIYPDRELNKPKEEEKPAE